MDEVVHERVQQRAVEQIVDVPVPQILTEIVEGMLVQCLLMNKFASMYQCLILEQAVEAGEKDLKRKLLEADSKYCEAGADILHRCISGLARTI